MTVTRVHVGNCGMETTIRASVDPSYQVKLEIQSACRSIQTLAQSLPPLNALDIGRTILGSPIYQLADRQLKHVSCPVPAAILRTVEVAAGIGLPDETTIRTYRDASPAATRL